MIESIQFQKTKKVDESRNRIDKKAQQIREKLSETADELDRILAETTDGLSQLVEESCEASSDLQILVSKLEKCECAAMELFGKLNRALDIEGKQLKEIAYRSDILYRKLQAITCCFSFQFCFERTVAICESGGPDRSLEEGRWDQFS